MSFRAYVILWVSAILASFLALAMVGHSGQVELGRVVERVSAAAEAAGRDSLPGHVRAEIDQAILEADRVHSTVDRWSLVTIAIVGLALVLGSLGLIRRVLAPVLSLSSAARKFGNSDFSTRAPIMRSDELGDVCRTFNEMARRLEDSEEAKLDFIAAVVHDLRNPLSVIGGAARLLLNRAHVEDDYQVEWLDRIRANAKRLELLTNDFMDSVQMAKGKLTLQTEGMDVADLGRTVMEEQALIHTSHRFRLDAESGCTINGDFHRLERVILNLLSNAIKYSPDGTTVRLELARDDSHAILRVTDEGQGISPEDMAVIFEPYRRGERASGEAKGTGLGLCVAKDIVELHAGAIHVYSAPGKGTTVEVRLPLEKAGAHDHDTEAPGLVGSD